MRDFLDFGYVRYVRELEGSEKGGYIFLIEGKKGAYRVFSREVLELDSPVLVYRICVTKDNKQKEFLVADPIDAFGGI